MITSKIPSILTTNLPKLRESNIRQQMWSHIFNEKQDPKDLKNYYGNDNHWSKAKENWDAIISAAQCEFILKYDYIPPYNSYTYTCNTSDLADGYIFNILDLNIPASSSHQYRNVIERFRKRDPKGEGFIIDVRGEWFSIAALYETTTHADYYHQVDFHKLSSIHLFDKSPDDTTISIVFNKSISALREY